MRSQIAADVVKDMRQYGQWPEMDDPIVLEGPKPPWLDQKIAAEKSQPK
jgi:hypothetical protein